MKGKQALKFFEAKVREFAVELDVEHGILVRVEQNCIYGARASAVRGGRNPFDHHTVNVSEKLLGADSDEAILIAIAFHEVAHLASRGHHGESFKAVCVEHGHHPNAEADAVLIRGSV